MCVFPCLPKQICCVFLVVFSDLNLSDAQHEVYTSNKGHMFENYAFNNEQINYFDSGIQIPLLAEDYLQVDNIQIVSQTVFKVMQQQPQASY